MFYYILILTEVLFLIASRLAEVLVDILKVVYVRLMWVSFPPLKLNTLRVFKAIVLSANNKRTD